MFIAVIGSPPIAKTSESAFVAATRPKSYGSSTIGAKKSSVCTSASSGESWYTPASSNVSRPTRIRGSARRSRGARTAERSPGPIFAAQPAQRANCVRRITSSRVAVAMWVSSRSAHLGHALDLHAYAARQTGDRHGGARGARSADVFRVHVVDLREVGHVHEEDGRLRDFGPAAPGVGEHGGEVLHHLLGLRGGVALDDLRGLRVERD